MEIKLEISELEFTFSLCISLLYTVSGPRSEHIDSKTATFVTFLSILLRKDTLKFQCLTK